MMKRFAGLLALVLALGRLTAGDGLTRRDAVVAMFKSNETQFLEAARQQDFKALESIDGVMEVSVDGSCVDIFCGGAGFGPSTHYYGIFYSGQDDLCAVSIACCSSADQLTADGAGYRCRQPGGDNEYYVEPLGHHYYYYEAHY